MQKRCLCYQGTPYVEQFSGECELFENTVCSQTAESAESVTRARSAEQPLHRLRSRVRADAEASRGIKAVSWSAAESF